MYPVFVLEVEMAWCCGCDWGFTGGGVGRVGLRGKFWVSSDGILTAGEFGTREFLTNGKNDLCYCNYGDRLSTRFLGKTSSCVPRIFHQNMRQSCRFVRSKRMRIREQHILYLGTCDKICRYGDEDQNVACTLANTFAGSLVKSC